MNVMKTANLCKSNHDMDHVQVPFIKLHLGNISGLTTKQLNPLLQVGEKCKALGCLQLDIIGTDNYN